MSAVPVSESGVRPILAEAVEQARRALVELEPTGVGVHLGVSAEDESSATHHFEATLPGYGGWQWAVVVAAPPEADHATVSESALLPGPDALVAPDFIPWDQRIRPGDLAPGDLLAPPADDPRLVPGYLATGDPVVDDVALELGLGRSQVLSREGREEAADRWYSEFGPDTDMARAAPSTCGLCGFYVPLAGSLRAAFGVCANAMGADGHVVHVDYGCGAHSDTVLPTGSGSPLYEAYDDAAVEVIPTADLRRPEEANTSAGAPEPTDAGQDAEQATIIEETATSDGTPAAADVADATAAPTPDRADATTASADAAEAVVTGEAVAEREGTTESTGTVGERVESTGVAGESAAPADPSAGSTAAGASATGSVAAETDSASGLASGNPSGSAEATANTAVTSAGTESADAAGESADPTDAAARATVAGVAESSAAVVDTTGAADSGAAGAVAEAEVTPVGMVAAAADADATDVVEFHGAAEAVAPVEVPGGEFGAPVAYSSDPAVAAAAVAGVVDSGEATLFDLYDPDAGPYDDAWGVAAVNVEPQGGESAPGSN